MTLLIKGKKTSFEKSHNNIFSAFYVDGSRSYKVEHLPALFEEPKLGVDVKMLLQMCEKA